MIGLYKLNMQACSICEMVEKQDKQREYIVYSILVICQELFEKDFDMFFRNKGNFNRPSGMLCTKPKVSSI